METRRDDILTRIKSNCIEVDRGFVLDGEPSFCLEWQGATSGEGNGAGRGYGRVSINGCTSAVHRVVATHYFGFIPLRRDVDHKCNNRLCCNPYHLEIVTPKENHRRRVRRSK